MQMESWVEFCSPQNISGAWQQNSAPAVSRTAAGDGDLSWGPGLDPPSNPSLWKPRDPKNDSRRFYLNPFLKLKSSP